MSRSLSRENLDKEHKEDDMPFLLSNNPAANKRLSIVATLLGNCTMCTSFPTNGGKEGDVGPTQQFVELHGLRFIGLGAVADELTPKERVYDTLEQLTTRTQRLVSIGYLFDKPDLQSDLKAPSMVKTTETLPLDVWNKKYPDEKSMCERTRWVVENITKKNYKTLKEDFQRLLKMQKADPSEGNNKYLVGITAHNLGVIEVLSGRPPQAITFFRDAIYLKESAFGQHDPEVALSWDELGIQLFAGGDFEGALTSFREAHRIRRMQPDASSRPAVAMVLNNMGCCYFQLGDRQKALEALREADEIQQKAIGSSAQADLDLLHVAIVICNCGYLHLSLKQYDEARSMLEGALLIQQSVLDDSHRAIRDTLSNLEFANAFHS